MLGSFLDNVLLPFLESRIDQNGVLGCWMRKPPFLSFPSFLIIAGILKAFVLLRKFVHIQLILSMDLECKLLTKLKPL